MRCCPDREFRAAQKFICAIAKIGFFNRNGGNRFDASMRAVLTNGLTGIWRQNVPDLPQDDVRGVLLA
jgi:hypothetical protein